MTRRGALRTAATAAAVTAAGTALAACASGAGGAAPTSQSPVVDLVVQVNTQGTVSFNKTTQAIFQNFIDVNFNQNPTYKGIRATAAAWGNASAQILDDLAGTGYADLVEMCCTDIPTLVQANFLLPLDSLLRQDNISTDLWSKGHISAETYGGQLFGLPSYDGTIVIYYRQDVLDDLGLDYPDETWTAADAQQIWTATSGNIKTTAGASKHRSGISAYWSGEYEWLNGWLRGWGALEMNDARDQALMDDPKAADCMNYWAPMFQSKVAMNRGSISDLVSENCVFLMHHSDAIIDAAQNLGTKYKWDILPVPIWPAGRTTGVTIDMYGMNSATKHPDEAWEAFKWFNLGSQNGDGTYNMEWPKFQIVSNFITPALVSLWDWWQTTVEQTAPPLAGKGLKWYADASIKGYAYPTIFFKYQPVQMTTVVNTWVAEIVETQTVDAATGLKQMADEINAAQQLGTKSAGQATSISKDFPVTGAAMATVKTGL